MSVTVLYRPSEVDKIPSATFIDGEPVWAELMRENADLGAVYVTVGQVDAWHVWVAWASDSSAEDEFMKIVPVSDDGESPFDFVSYTQALQVAIRMS